MAILVTGGGGYIGFQMVLQLLDAGQSVVVLDQFSAGVEGFDLKNATLVRGDCGDAVVLEQIAKSYTIDTVFHFAASVSVSESVSDPLQYYQNNTVRTANLLQAWARYGWGPLIFSSTAAVYDSSSVGLLSETSPMAPISPYAWSKAMSEQMISDTAKACDRPYAILRYFNVAGADPMCRNGQRSPGSQHLLTNVCRVSAGEADELRIFGTDYATPDGTCVRDYIHLCDLIDAHVLIHKALSNDGVRFSGIYNCGYGRGFSVMEVLRAYQEVTGKVLPHSFAPRRDGDPDSLIANSSKIKSMLGWSPKYDDLNLITEHALAWDALWRKQKTS